VRGRVRARAEGEETLSKLLYFKSFEFFDHTHTRRTVVHVIVRRQDGSVLFSRQEVEVTVFKRITVRPEQMGGIPCIRGLRIPVATVVRMVSEGMTESEILNEYPDLELDDIREALRYAAEAVRERELPVAGGA
jgi:uncharacterized protein (DUF433 family)